MVVIGGASNGVEDVVNEILRLVKRGSVFVLRFHGHGLPGIAGISDGTSDSEGCSSSLRTSNRKTMALLHRLAPIFGPYGCIHLMHCDIARQNQGRALLREISLLTGVPTTGGLSTQYGGVNAARFHGRTFTAFPAGLNMQGLVQTRKGIDGEMSYGMY